MIESISFIYPLHQLLSPTDRTVYGGVEGVLTIKILSFSTELAHDMGVDGRCGPNIISNTQKLILKSDQKNDYCYNECAVKSIHCMAKERQERKSQREAFFGRKVSYDFNPLPSRHSPDDVYTCLFVLGPGPSGCAV